METSERSPKRPAVRRVLNDRLIHGLKAASKDDRTFVYDLRVPGLGVSVTDRGTKTFILNTRYPTPQGMKPARSALGKVGALTLAEARAKAQAWHQMIERGVDPREEEKRQQAGEIERRKNTFGAVAEDFIEHIKARKQRKAKQVENEIRRELLPHWESRPITDIQDGDVTRLVRKLATRAPYVAHGVYGHVRSIFNFAIGNGESAYGIKSSPCDRLRPSTFMPEKESRQRTLNDDELRAYWYATEKMDYPYCHFYKLIVLTGQRLNEVAGARWREFDFEQRLWTIPSERFKSNHVQWVPITDDMMNVLKSLPHFADSLKDATKANRDCLFSTDGGYTPINGFSKGATLLRQYMAEELDCDTAELTDREKKDTSFVIHDVRRTVRTKLSFLRVQYEVAELVIGHTLTGLHKVYDQHKYIVERREALQDWANHLMSIVDPPNGSNVVPFKRETVP